LKTRGEVVDLNLAEWLERIIVTPDDVLSKSDVIIAIGCTLDKAGTRPSPQSAAIALKAQQLYEAGWAPNVLFVGKGYNKPMPTTEAWAMCDLVNLPKSVVTLEEASYTTRMNTIAIAAIMQANGWRSAIVVAQQLHARRVRLAIRRACPGRQIVVVKAWSPYGNSSKWFLNHFWTFLIWDTLALIYSKLRGWA